METNEFRFLFFKFERFKCAVIYFGDILQWKQKHEIETPTSFDWIEKMDSNPMAYIFVYTDNSYSAALAYRREIEARTDNSV